MKKITTPCEVAELLNQLAAILQYRANNSGKMSAEEITFIAQLLQSHANSLFVNCREQIPKSRSVAEVTFKATGNVQPR